MSAAHLPGVRALFDACSCTCHCQYWHFVGTKNEWLDRCAHRPEENAHAFASKVTTGDPAGRGLVAKNSDCVVGWMKLTARHHVAKLRNLPVYRNLDLGDESSTYSIGCLLVAPDARGQGVARALIEAAPEFVRVWGGDAVEGYPRRDPAPLYPEEAWQGPERAFVAARYEVVHDLAPYPVYRKRVGPI